MNTYIGTSGYGYKEWKGKFYPKDLSPKQMLNYYGEHFNAVEINNTFYKLPAPGAMEPWTLQVPKHFRFALKAPQLITHRKRLKDCREPLDAFLDAARVLGTRLGPLLFQLPPNMKKDAARLSDFLQLLPKQTRATFEFRNQTWFDDEVFNLLKSHQVALCIAEDDDLQTPFVPTAGWGYLRLRKAKYSKKDLQQVSARIRKQKWKNAFVFFKHEDQANGPKFATILSMHVSKK